MHAPPSTTRVCPVMKSLSDEAKKTIAPTRSSGFCVLLSARSSAAAARILTMPSSGFSSDSVLPGAMQLTQMPSLPTSHARLRGDVVDAARRALQGRARADVDDLAVAALAHVRHRGARGEPGAAQVDGHHAVPLLDLDLVERRARPSRLPPPVRAHRPCRCRARRP